MSDGDSPGVEVTRDQWEWQQFYARALPINIDMCALSARRLGRTIPQEGQEND